MSLERPAHNGQPQTGAPWFASPQNGCKGATADLFGHAVPGIIELDRYMSRTLAVAGQMDWTGSDGESAALGHGLGRIQDEIEERLLQLGGFAQDRRQFWLELLQNFHILVFEFMPDQ